MPVLDLLIASSNGSTARCRRRPHDPFRCFVWEVLVHPDDAGTRDARIAALQRIPALTPDAMCRAARRKLEAAVALRGPLPGTAAPRAASSRRRPVPPRSRVWPRSIRGPVRRRAGVRKALPRWARRRAPDAAVRGGTIAVLPVDPRHGATVAPPRYRRGAGTIERRGASDASAQRLAAELPGDPAM